jgi:hypothetical protein
MIKTASERQPARCMFTQNFTDFSDDSLVWFNTFHMQRLKYLIQSEVYLFLQIKVTVKNYIMGSFIIFLYFTSLKFLNQFDMGRKYSVCGRKYKHAQTIDHKS